jgi:uncharacterized alkaline shock family protein YloU
MSEATNPLGTIFVSHRAISTIAYQSALESYGVVGFAAKNFAQGITQVLVKDPALGVEVHFDGHSIKIDLFIIVEYGVRITAVSTSVADAVRFQIEKATGLQVGQVNIHVRGLRISNAD